MKRIASALLTLSCAYITLLVFPYPLFSYQAQYENIRVYSDRPLSAALPALLGDVQKRLTESPLNDTTLQHRIFLCNDDRRFAFFVNTDYRVGGLNYTWLNRNIFLRRSDIDRNRLISRSGKEVPGERTLGYFLTHEITHSLEVNALGRFTYARLPVWKREGYADYVAKARDFHFEEELAAFRRGDPEMDPARSGLYLRHELLVYYLIQSKGLSLRTILNQSFSEADLKQELTQRY